MPVCRFFLVLAVGLFCATLPTSAILIESKDGKVGGYVEDDDGTKLVIRVRTPDGREKRERFEHAKITILHRLDVKRLEGLSRDNPKAYRDYAEELARHKDDPEARDTAMRLYLIAAKLAPEKFGSSSLLGMSALASPAEARKCRAMAFLLDPKADAGVLKDQAAKPVQPAKFPAGALGEFTRALQHYRAGRIQAAMDTAKHEGVEKVFSMTPEKIDQKTFLGWCNDASCKTCKPDGTVACTACKGSGVILNMFGQYERCPTCSGKKKVICPDCGGTHVRDPLPDDALRVVLRSELWALDQQGAGDDAGRKDATEAKGWSAVLQSRRLSPVLPLSLETITDFDPRKCRYRNGKWVEDSAP
jgi:hypothetical protein